MLKLGIIGTSWISEAFCEAAKLSGQYTLEAIYSRNINKGKNFAIKNEIKSAFDQLSDFLNHSIDVVYIASPNALHYEHAIACIKAGKHVIVEKPAFSNQLEMTSVLNLAKSKNVYYFEAARHIFEENYKRAKNIISKMKTIQGARLSFAKYSSKYDAFLAGENPNVFSAEFSGGALYDLGVYPLYLAVDLFGCPETVFNHSNLLSTGADGVSTSVLKYKDFDVILFCAKILQSYTPSEVYGLDETIVLGSVVEIETVKRYQFKENKEGIEIGIERPKNTMIYEAQTFAEILNNPEKEENKKNYVYLKQLSVDVNRILEDLRKTSGITFPNAKITEV